VILSYLIKPTPARGVSLLLLSIFIDLADIYYQMKSLIFVAVLFGIVLQAVNTSRILQTRCVTLNISVTGGGGGGGEGGGGERRRLQVLCDNFEYVASGNNSCIRD